MTTFSVIIPTYNRADFVVQAVHSVLNQTCQDFELIVVDDGSTDQTASLLSPLLGGKFQLIRQDRGERSFARNRGIQAASGRYLAFLDSDDLWKPNKLEVQNLALERYPEKGLSYSNFDRIDQFGNPIPWPFYRKPEGFSGDIFQALLTTRCSIRTSTVVIRRDLIPPGEGFLADLKVAEDLELFLRLSRLTEAYYHSECLASYRVHPGQTMSMTSAATLEESLRRALEPYFRDGLLPASVLRRSMATRKLRLGLWYARERSLRPALRSLQDAALLWPPIALNWKWWGVLALSFNPRIMNHSRISHFFSSCHPPLEGAPNHQKEHQ